MKTLLTISLSILCMLCCNGQSYLDKEGNTHLWGKVEVAQLMEKPYADWYEKYSKDFQPSFKKADAALFKDLSVKVFIGTWCGDTQFLLPKFIKSWQQMGLSEEQLTIIALHHEGENYKQAPNKETEGLNIHRVPTFIFYENGQEIGRIVERTVFDLETDMKLIAQKRPYQHRYQAVAIVSELIANNIDSLNSETFLADAIEKTEREISTESELNTLAYTLSFAGELQKAAFIFKLNRHLFPFDPYIRYGYGRALFKLDQFANAKQELLEAIRLKPDFKNAIKYLYDINEKM